MTQFKHPTKKGPDCVVLVGGITAGAFSFDSTDAL